MLLLVILRWCEDTTVTAALAHKRQRMCPFQGYEAPKMWLGRWGSRVERRHESLIVCLSAFKSLSAIMVSNMAACVLLSKEA